MDIDEATDRPRILLIDGDTASRRALQLSLHAAGLIVRAYASADILVAKPPSAQCLILSDISSDPDQTDVLARLKAAGWTGPAILLAVAPSAQAAHGFNKILDNPPGRQDLIEAIYAILKATPPT